MSEKVAAPQFKAFADAYRARFIAAIEGWDMTALEQVAKVFSDARARKARVLIAGNGGSAAVANHTECDATKGTHVAGTPVLDTRSLAANTSVLTALGNDFGYETVFSKQVEYYGRAGDVLLVVSSSGNSPNVVEAAKSAKALGMTVIAFVGFGGGALKGMCDHVLHIPVNDYGVVEDMHQASIHLVTQFLRATWEAAA